MHGRGGRLWGFLRPCPWRLAMTYFGPEPRGGWAGALLSQATGCQAAVLAVAADCRACPPCCCPLPCNMQHATCNMQQQQNAADGVSEARRQLLKGAVASRSDHLALVAAYNAWCRAVDKGG